MSSDEQFRKRFARQIHLQEIGEAGQMRICAAPLRIGGAFGEETCSMAGRFAAASGMQRTIDLPCPSRFPQELEKFFRYPEAQAIGQGAALCLASIWAALHEAVALPEESPQEKVSS